jgi:hypothetical protein
MALCLICFDYFDDWNEINDGFMTLFFIYIFVFTSVSIFISASVMFIK